MKEQEAETLTLPPEFKFDGEPGDIITLKLVARGEDGSLRVERVAEDVDVDAEPDESPDDEDLKTTLRRDMAAIPPEGEE